MVGWGRMLVVDNEVPVEVITALEETDVATAMALLEGMTIGGAKTATTLTWQ